LHNARRSIAKSTEAFVLNRDDLALVTATDARRRSGSLQFQGTHPWAGVRRYNNRVEEELGKADIIISFGGRFPTALAWAYVPEVVTQGM
jgi:hypothetical protein